MNRISHSQISIPKVFLSFLPQLSSSLKHSHTTVDLAAERQQISISRSAVVAILLGFFTWVFGLVLILVWDGFPMGLNWFWVGFPGGVGLFLSWVSRWVLIDFELGFLMGLAWFWVGFSSCLCCFWFNFPLILGQLCGRLSTVQMICVGVGWVVVGAVMVVVVVVGRLSSTSSFFFFFFFLCFAGLLWTLGWSSLIEER